MRRKPFLINLGTQKKLILKDKLLAALQEASHNSALAAMQRNKDAMLLHQHLHFLIERRLSLVIDGLVWDYARDNYNHRAGRATFLAQDSIKIVRGWKRRYNGKD